MRKQLEAIIKDWEQAKLSDLETVVKIKEILRSPLWSEETKDRQIRQMEINQEYLLKAMDKLHGILCPQETGTWQDRVVQTITAAECL